MSFHQLNRGLKAAAMFASVVLVACGGGGGGGSSDSSVTPFPESSQHVAPDGMRTDVAAQNLFPFNNGDIVTYDRLTNGQVDGTVTRSFAPVGAGPWFDVTEIDSTAPSDPQTLRYQFASFGGDDLVQLQDPFGLAGTSLQSLYNRFSVLNEYHTLLYPVGSQEKFTASGDLGADADGDGRSDSFLIEYTQVFRGFETQLVFGSSTQVAHFSNGLTMTIRGTKTGRDVVTTWSEETYFAPNIGLVQRDTSNLVVDQQVIAPAYSIRARSGSVGGISYP